MTFFDPSPIAERKRRLFPLRGAYTSSIIKALTSDPIWRCRLEMVGRVLSLSRKSGDFSRRRAALNKVVDSLGVAVQPLMGGGYSHPNNSVSTVYQATARVQEESTQQPWITGTAV